jgi:hypothetical protein
VPLEVLRCHLPTQPDVNVSSRRRLARRQAFISATGRYVAEAVRWTVGVLAPNVSRKGSDCVRMLVQLELIGLVASQP